jgi:DNA polymerase III epsilon subunit-like protein
VAKLYRFKYKNFLINLVKSEERLFLNLFSEIEFDKQLYLKQIGNKTQTSKVSLFNKHISNSELDKKRVLILDFEYSKNYKIYEIGAIVIENRNVVETWFEEFSLPIGEPYFNFKQKYYEPVTEFFNFGKREILDSDLDRLFKLLKESDFIVAHNFTSEMMVIHNILYPNMKYSVENLEIYKNGKIICTNRSFNNRYFKNMEIFDSFSNLDVSKQFGWDISVVSKGLLISNSFLNTRFIFSKIPENIKNLKLHNAFYDSVVTLTNLLSLKYMQK